METKYFNATASSDSSYVIARRKECSPETIYGLLNTETNRKDIENSWEFKSLGNTLTVDQVLEEIADRLFNPHYQEMKLDGWLVCAEAFSSESGDEIESIICNYIEIKENDMFKMGGFS